jgi:hypothetical protein
VLVCPGCQASYDWMSDLDGCPVCASVHLVRRLGEVECRDCGGVRQPAAPALPGHLAGLTGDQAGQGDQVGQARRGLTLGTAVAGGGPAPQREPAARPDVPGRPDPGGDTETVAMRGLAQEVEEALARVLGRTAGSAAGG